MSRTDAQLFKFDIANTALVSSILKFVGLGQAEFLSDQIVTNMVFGVTGQVVVLLLVQNFLKGSVQLSRVHCSWRRANHGQLELVTLLVSVLGNHFAFNSLHIVLEASEGRRRPLPLGKGRQVLQLVLNVLDVTAQ